MTKDWLSFLSAAFRLVDLHDTARGLGVAGGTLREERTGRGDGVWLDLAVRLLAYLDECDLESNEGWNPLGPFIKDMSARQPRLQAEDVQQVVAYLATPTEVRYLKDEPTGPRIAATRDTALVERRALRGQPDLCRLTQRGRLAVGLAKVSHNWLYTHHDADKLMTAVQYGEFQDLPRQCATLGQAIRAFSHELTRVLEQPGRAELVAHFLDRGSQYLDSIRRVQTAVQNAREALGTAEVRARFGQWLDTQPDGQLDLGGLRRTLDELMQAVERLGWRFSAFLSQVTGARREVVGNIPFEKAALAFVFRPPDPRTLDALVEGLGAWLPALAFPGPEDMQGLLRAEVDSHQAAQARVFGAAAGATQAPGPMDMFVEARRAEILAALAQGPVGLGQALARGWARVDGGGEGGPEGATRLTELVGVYTAPSWLGPEGRTLRLTLRRGALEAHVDGRHWLAGDDIELSLDDTGEKAGEDGHGPG